MFKFSKDNLPIFDFETIWSWISIRIWQAQKGDFFVQKVVPGIICVFFLPNPSRRLSPDLLVQKVVLGGKPMKTISNTKSMTQIAFANGQTGDILVQHPLSPENIHKLVPAFLSKRLPLQNIKKGGSSSPDIKITFPPGIKNNCCNFLRVDKMVFSTFIAMAAKNTSLRCSSSFF